MSETQKLIFKLLPMLFLFSSLKLGVAQSTLQDKDSTLTLKTALEKALEKNLDLKQSSNQLLNSKVNYKQSRNNLLPDLRASLSMAQRFDRQYDTATDRTSNRDELSMSGNVQSSLNLFNGFGDLAAIDQARDIYTATGHSFQRQKETIIYQTVASFLQAVQDAELIKIEKENRTAQKDQLDLILEFYNTGNRSISDVLLQRADIAEAELRVLNAERNYEISRLNLLEIMGEMPDQTYILLGPNNAIIEAIANPPGEEIFSYEQRNDWSAQQNLIRVAEAGIREARADYWPALGLSLSAGSSYSDDREGLGFSKQFNEINPSASASLSLSIPIFDRFRTHNDVQIAQIQLDNAELDLEKLKLTIELDIQQARLDYQTGIKQRQTAQAKLDFATQSLEVMQERYTVGSATYVELSQIRANHLSAANDRVQAEYNLLLKRVALSYYLGTIEKTLSEINLLENES